jgi:hypothetical protein
MDPHSPLHGQHHDRALEIKTLTEVSLHEGLWTFMQAASQVLFQVNDLGWSD